MQFPICLRGDYLERTEGLPQLTAERAVYLYQAVSADEDTSLSGMWQRLLTCWARACSDMTEMAVLWTRVA